MTSSPYAARSKAASDARAFGILPFLQFEETADHQSKFLGKLFNGSVDNSSCLLSPRVLDPE
jgi:hypothetical protein